MHTIDQLLDLARSANDLPSDYKLAQALDLGRQSISNYRTGRNLPDPEVCRRLAYLAKLDPDYVLCCVESARTTDEKTSAQWTRIAARLQAGAGAAAAVILSALFLSSPEPANAMDKGTAAVWVSSDGRLPVYTSWQVSKHTRSPIFMGICVLLSGLFQPLARAALHRV
jgi:transcriptional regulator with XRE-family HTH domain